MRTGRIASLVVAASLAAARHGAGSTWTVPGAVNASGLNGTKFVSDVALTNPGTVPAVVSMRFLPAGAAEQALALAPGQTFVARNVVSSLFGLSGAGALSITSDQPLLLRARTYNTASSGTYGVSLPVVADDRLFGPGDRGESLWISQDAGGTTGFRTNIAVVFPDAGGGGARVTVYDADGAERGHQDFSLDAAGLQQFSVGSFAGAVAVARAELTVTNGRAAAYAVVVDNVTGDSSLFSFEDLPAGAQDALVNGVARANGRNGAFFRTDGRFYNPTDTEATIQVSFHANQASNPSPRTASFTLAPGKIRDVVDVLDSLLGLPVGSAGALRFRSNWPVAILCRTSNVDPSGSRPGTFGSQQKPVPLLSFVTSADAGAAITGIRQDAAFRTNVGFAAGPEGAAYSLTLAAADGTTVGTATASLGAFGWTQPGIQDLFPAVTVPPDATLRVEVTDGSLDVFDSSIDNLSGDPVVTPIAPLPAGVPPSATIGPQGGSIRTSDGRLTMRVPAGALGQPVSFSFQPVAGDAPQGVGPVYQLLPPGITFAKPALLTLAYGAAETESSSAEALILAARQAAGWLILGGGFVDAARRTLTVPLPATSPASAARAPARAASADGPNEIAVVQSWQFVASGRQAVLTSGRLDFSVYSVGGGASSSTLGDLLTGTLSTSPDRVEADWFVSGRRGGNELLGTIVYEPGGGNLSVVYLAPACRPPENPVIVEAFVANRSGFLRRWYQASGSARVRVVSRDWRLTVKPAFTWGCGRGHSMSDVVTWNDSMEVAFTLDENFHVGRTFELSQPASHQFGGCPVCPGGSATSPRNKGTDSNLYVDLIADWNRDADAMTLDLTFAYDGPTDLWETCPGSSEIRVPREDLFRLHDADDVSPGLRWRLITPTTDGSSNLEIRLALLEDCR